MILEPIGNLWGSERSLMDLVRSLSSQAWQIGVYCPSGSPLVKMLNELPVTVFPYFEAGLHLKRRGRRIIAAFRLLLSALKFNPCLIHVNQPGGLEYALAVARVLRLPVTTHVRFHEDVDYVSTVAVQADGLRKIICISQYITGLFTADGRVAPARLAQIYNPYKFQADSVNIAQTIDATTIKFSCVARFEPNKRQDLLLSALALLRRKSIIAQVIFYGSPIWATAFASQLLQQATDLNVEQQITWAGFSNDVVSHLAGCTAQVCPFQKEALGRVIFEAWDGGTVPVAWAGSGGPAEVISACNGGILYDQQTEEDLAKALEEAICLAPAERRAMIQRGRAWLLANCDPGLHAKKIIGLWQEVLEARPISKVTGQPHTDILGGRSD